LSISPQDNIGEGDPNLVGSALQAALATLRARDWHGLAGEIARTGEEDPLALVDDPDLRAVIAAKMELRRSHEASMFQDLGSRESEFGRTLLEYETAAPADRSTTDWTEILTSLAAEVHAIVDRLAQGPSSRDHEIARLFLLSKFCDLAALAKEAS
jgi:glycyl-tRNA synthetase beta chain